MSSTFGSLQIGVRALQAYQIALGVTGQNVANADTKGYSRQVALLTTTDPYNNPTGPGQIGAGVDVSAIISMRDRFIDAQIRSASSDMGDLEAQQSVYQYIETVFNESSKSSISNCIDNFWTDLQKLSTNASNPAYRSAVLEGANTLTANLKDTYNQLVKLQKDCNSKVTTLVDQVNTLAGQVSDLNEIIRQVTASGQSANDLMDQREQLTQQLAELVNISVQTTSTNEYNITINGATLVSGDDVYSLKTVDANADGLSEVVWASSGGAAAINGGRIGGYLEMRDAKIGSYIDKLNQFTKTLITEFNSVHAAGYGVDGSTTGVAFFSGTGVADIGVAITDLNQIAAANTTTGSGDGDNATDLCDVLNKNTYSGTDDLTLDQYFNKIINRLAVEANTSYSGCENKQSLVSYLNQQQQSVAGVLKDEEAANLIKYENSYNAASRYVTVIDQMLDVLINSTGVVGL